MTRITVRVQAKGGKFLGDDIGGALVTIRDAQTQKLLADGKTVGDSGKLCHDYSARATQRAVVTPGDEPTVQWLEATRTTSSFDAALDLKRPTLLEVSAYGPMGGLQSAHTATKTQWVAPGDDHLATGPGFVVELPGLLVQIMKPATHLMLSEAGSVELETNVTMMCGCPITSNKAWHPDDFEVVATVRRMGLDKTDENDRAETVRHPLCFEGTQPSLFIGTIDVSRVGYYEATVTAVQKSTGNTGLGQVTFFLQQKKPAK